MFISIFIILLIAIYAGQIKNATYALNLNENIDTLSNEGTLHRRSYFYVGGEYVSAQNSVQVSFGQMYVEHLVPIKVMQPFPIVIIPGNGMTGTNFLNTPDGRLGWADYFLSQGYELYIVDQPSRGRSAWQQGIDGPQNIFDTLTIEKRFTATQRFQLWPQASLLTQWLGNGSVGDDTFYKFYSSIVPGLVSNVETSEKMKHAGSALLDRVGSAVLLTHSQAGQFGWILADARPSKVKAIIAIEPMGPPFTNAIFPPLAPARPYGLTEIPLTFSPPIQSAADLQPQVVSSSINFTCIQQASPPRKLVNLGNVRVLVVTSEAGYHSVYDECSVEFLRDAGVSVDHVRLEDVGIHGNGHLMFMEKNNLQIADGVVRKWLNEVL
ncbi:alpha/beta-hydrolase [Phlegmacium glaucopus]|nr:alpha/beta-hydrolase [Phlegmacium glaucopus]